MAAALISVASRLSTEYSTVRRSFALPSESETQKDVMALLSWDLDKFCSASPRLLEEGHWGPGFAMVRLISERAEYLLAAHEDAAFAAEFWTRSSAITDAPEKAPRNRSGEARTFVRRVAERRRDSDVSDHLLKTLIEKHDWESVAVHPSAVVAALASDAETDPNCHAASTVAASVAIAVWFSLAALLLIVEERGGQSVAEVDTAREVLAGAARVLRESGALDPDNPHTK